MLTFNELLNTFDAIKDTFGEDSSEVQELVNFCKPKVKELLLKALPIQAKAANLRSDEFKLAEKGVELLIDYGPSNPKLNKLHCLMHPSNPPHLSVDEVNECFEEIERIKKEEVK